jgi:hypothetical protein
MLISAVARGPTAVVVHRQELMSIHPAGTSRAANTHVAAASRRLARRVVASRLPGYEYPAVKLGPRKTRPTHTGVASSERDPIHETCSMILLCRASGRACMLVLKAPSLHTGLEVPLLVIRSSCTR